MFSKCIETASLCQAFVHLSFRPVVRMANRHRQRICCICAAQLCAGQQNLEHRLYLRFFSAACADDGLFDKPRGIFGHRHATARRREQAHAARLAKFERRLRIGVHKDFLNRRTIRLVLQNDVSKGRVERDQSVRQRGLWVGGNLAIGDMTEPVSLGRDNPPAGRTKAGIKAEDEGQPNCSSTSSAMV